MKSSVARDAAFKSMELNRLNEARASCDLPDAHFAPTNVSEHIRPNLVIGPDWPQAARRSIRTLDGTMERIMATISEMTTVPRVLSMSEITCSVPGSNRPYAQLSGKAVLRRRKGYLRRRLVTPKRFRLASEGEADLEDLSVRHQARASPVLPSLRRCRLLSSASESSNDMVNARCHVRVDLKTVERVAFDGKSWEVRPDAPYRGIWKLS